MCNDPAAHHSSFMLPQCEPRERARVSDYYYVGGDGGDEWQTEDEGSQVIIKEESRERKTLTHRSHISVQALVLVLMYVCLNSYGSGYYGNTTEEEMMEEVMTRGPIVVGIDAHYDLFHYQAPSTCCPHSLFKS
jgi:hypothetical protein